MDPVNLVVVIAIIGVAALYFKNKKK